MEAPVQPRRATTRATLEHEISLIDSSIEMLAAGAADRVTLTGLRFAERILPTAQRSASTRNVAVRLLWRHDGVGCDIALEPRV